MLLFFKVFENALRVNPKPETRIPNQIPNQNEKCLVRDLVRGLDSDLWFRISGLHRSTRNQAERPSIVTFPATLVPAATVICSVSLVPETTEYPGLGLRTKNAPPLA